MECFELCALILAKDCYLSGFRWIIKNYEWHVINSRCSKFWKSTRRDILWNVSVLSVQNVILFEAPFLSQSDNFLPLLRISIQLSYLLFCSNKSALIKRQNHRWVGAVVTSHFNHTSPTNCYLMKKKFFLITDYYNGNSYEPKWNWTLQKIFESHYYEQLNTVGQVYFIHDWSDTLFKTLSPEIQK